MTSFEGRTSRLARKKKAAPRMGAASSRVHWERLFDDFNNASGMGGQVPSGMWLEFGVAQSPEA